METNKHTYFQLLFIAVHCQMFAEVCNANSFPAILVHSDVLKSGVFSFGSVSCASQLSSALIFRNSDCSIFITVCDKNILHSTAVMIPCDISCRNSTKRNRKVQNCSYEALKNMQRSHTQDKLRNDNQCKNVRVCKYKNTRDQEP